MLGFFLVFCAHLTWPLTSLHCRDAVTEYGILCKENSIYVRSALVYWQ